MSGFSLIEVTIALVIIMIALLGAFAVMAYAITHNGANKARALGAAMLQQEVERYRSAKFNSMMTDNFASPNSPEGMCLLNGLRDLRGRNESTCLGVGTGQLFTVTSSVDNDPFTAGIQDESYTCRSPQGAAMPCAIKEVTITVKLAAPSPGWQSAVPITAVFQRVRGN